MTGHKALRGARRYWPSCLLMSTKSHETTTPIYKIYFDGVDGVVWELKGGWEKGIRWVMIKHYPESLQRPWEVVGAGPSISAVMRKAGFSVRSRTRWVLRVRADPPLKVGIPICARETVSGGFMQELVAIFLVFGVLIALTLGVRSCHHRMAAPARCGDLVPVQVDRYGSNTSETWRKCPGSWTPVPTGAWYRCACGGTEDSK